MFRLIKKLQQKSESVRRRIAWGTTLVVIALVLVVWVSTFSSRSTPREEREVQTVTPFQSFGDSFSHLFEDINGGEDLLDIASSTDTTAPFSTTTAPVDEATTTVE